MMPLPHVVALPIAPGFGLLGQRGNETGVSETVLMKKERTYSRVTAGLNPPGRAPENTEFYSPPCPVVGYWETKGTSQKSRFVSAYRGTAVRVYAAVLTTAVVDVKLKEVLSTALLAMTAAAAEDKCRCMCMCFRDC